MQAGRAAFEQTNFAEAMAQAGVALGLKPKEGGGDQTEAGRPDPNGVAGSSPGD